MARERILGGEQLEKKNKEDYEKGMWRTLA